MGKDGVYEIELKLKDRGENRSEKLEKMIENFSLLTLHL